MDDSFDLDRFVTAQAPLFEQVLAELRQGRKVSHWMWFIFPQVAGLGHSRTSIKYAISGLEEAKAYLEHPLLGTRLRQCVAILAHLEGPSALEIFGSIDAQKLKSSMTLFSQAAPGEACFQRLLNHYYGGQADQATLNILNHEG